MQQCILSRGWYFKKDQTKMKRLVDIVNKILNHFFLLKIVTGVNDLDFTRQVVSRTLS